MVSHAQTAPVHASLHNCVRRRCTLVHQLPENALPLNGLRALEARLYERGLLHAPQSEFFYPLWFIAETERNIFLWKHGLSLTDVGAFEFWVDVKALVSKRLGQLDAYSPSNPFVNSLWSHDGSGEEQSGLEREYLLSFEKIVKGLQSHISAIYTVGHIIENQVQSSSRLPEIVLPGGLLLERSAA